ncbi:MAG: peptidylprolyl isomerase [Anaerolineaceae bacterium]|nr:peptidylprolyl isomerase [Anaerolineaceae bacterium]
MRNTWVCFILLIAILLAGCAPGAQANPAATKTAALPENTSVPTVDSKAIKMECQVVSLSPTPGPTEVSMFPPVQKDDWILGSAANPPLTIIEYSDFQCPYCALLAVDLEKLVQKHPDDIQVVFRHFPLPSHPLSMIGAYATEAAGLQGKFWEMQNRIFASQETTISMTEAQFTDWLVEQAQDLKLDKDQFIKDMGSPATLDKVKQAQQHGLDIGIPGTPLVLINGQPYQGPRDEASIEAILKLFQLGNRQFTACPPMVINPQKQYNATIETEKGNVILQLFADKAPQAVNSFVFLAQQGWFNGVTFHRVMPGFIAQSGDPSGSGMGGPGYYFRNETNDLKFDKPGVLGMANAGQDSNGSQFFITFKAAPDLDGKYTIFGEVIDGMDVLEKLTPRDPSQEMGLPPGDKIINITIKEK